MTTALQTTDSESRDSEARDLTAAAAKREQAKAYIKKYREENGGAWPTGKMVGDECGLTDKWGRNQLASFRSDDATPGSGTIARRRPETVGEFVERSGAADSSSPATVVIGPVVPEHLSARSAVPPAERPAPRTERPAAQSPARPERSASPAAPDSGTPTGRPAGTPTVTPPPARPQRPVRARVAVPDRGGRLAAWVAEWVASGQLIAWISFAFGSVVSILGNVMDAWIAPAGVDPATWKPSVATQFGAAVWPVALLLSVEVLSRVKWAKGWGWGLARFGGVGVVALGSAVISFGHLHHLLTAWGYTRAGAIMGPISIDGLMVIAGFALLSISQTRRGGHSGGQS